MLGKGFGWVLFHNPGSLSSDIYLIPVEVEASPNSLTNQLIDSSTKMESSVKSGFNEKVPVFFGCT